MEINPNQLPARSKSSTYTLIPPSNYKLKQRGWFKPKFELLDKDKNVVFLCYPTHSVCELKDAEKNLLVEIQDKAEMFGENVRQMYLPYLEQSTELPLYSDIKVISPSKFELAIKYKYRLLLTSAYDGTQLELRFKQQGYSTLAGMLVDSQDIELASFSRSGFSTSYGKLKIFAKIPYQDLVVFITAVTFIMYKVIDKDRKRVNQQNAARYNHHHHHNH